MQQQVDDLQNEFNFENLFNYLYQIYLNGEYRNIPISFIDFEGSKYITFKSNRSMSWESISIYEVMNEGTPLEERNCIRYFDEDGDYSDNMDLEGVLKRFNELYSSKLQINHIVK